MDINELSNRFLTQPLTGAQKSDMDWLDQIFLSLSLEINAAISDGREKSLVMTHLQEALHWAHESIK